MLSKLRIPICGFVAYSGTGKTTLLERLIPILVEKGIRVGMIKHAHHRFDIDHPGKDSHRLRKAGAIETMVASGHRWALIHEERPEQDDPELDELLSHMSQDSLDIILVEGFKHVRFPRIELNRSALQKPLLFPEDDSIIAVASDKTIETHSAIIQLDINDPHAITNFIEETILTPKRKMND